MALANSSGTAKVAPVAAAADGWALARSIPGGPVAWVALSFTVDTNRRELRLLADAVQRCRPDGVLADFPAGGPH